MIGWFFEKERNKILQKAKNNPVFSLYRPVF